MKVLLTASVLCHIALFHKQLINMLKARGYIVHVAAADDLAEKDGLRLENIDRFHNIAFRRNPFSIANISAYRKLRRLIDAERYNIIHCHTPAVGVLARLAARQSRLQHGTKVFYTAHGFHFYKGAPLLNWLFYYPIEKYMCRHTDTLVTINEEDTLIVRKHFAVRNVHMHGVGADASRFFPVGKEEKQTIRQRLRLDGQQRVILFAGELIARKNPTTLIRVAALLSSVESGLRVLLAGNGPLEHQLRALIYKLKLEDRVCLLGYRSNISQYVQAADLVVSCSFQEGLPVNIMEAMLVGKPVVVSDIRGHRELVQEGVTGFLVSPTDVKGYADRIMRLLNDDALYHNMSHAARERGMLYTINRVLPELEQLYSISDN